MAKRKQSVQFDPEINHAMIPRTPTPQLCAQAYRHYRAQVRSVLDSNSSDGPDHEARSPKRRRQMKLKDRDVYFHQYHDASKVTKATITKHLNVRFTCPTNTKYGEELAGSSWTEIVQDLLDDINKTLRFPAKDADAMINSTNESMPVEQRLKMELHVQPVVDVLKMVQFRSDTDANLHESYHKIKQALIAEIKKYTQSRQCDDSLRKLLEFVDASLSGDKSSHALQVDFFRFILDKFCSPTTEDGTFSHKLLWKGNLKVMEVCLPVGKPTQDVIGVKPDLLFETTSHEPCDNVHSSDGNEHGEGGNYNYLNRPTNRLFRAFCMEFKATKEGFQEAQSCRRSRSLAVGECSEAGSSGRESQGYHGYSDIKHPTRRSSNDSDWTPDCATPPGMMPAAPSAEYDPIDPSSEQLQSQHLAGLLAMMMAKDPQRGTLYQAHSYGFYVVMHRVYVTGLQVQLPGSLNDHALRRAAVLGGVDEALCRYNMACCKYFNLFKPEHFKAFMEFLYYLVYQQTKDYDFF